MEMMFHSLPCPLGIPACDRINDGFVFGEAVVIDGRSGFVGSHAAPCDGAADCLHDVHQTEQEAILRSLHNKPVEIVVRGFIFPPRFDAAAPCCRSVKLFYMRGRGVGGRECGELGFQDKARLYEPKRARGAGYLRDIDGSFDRFVADEGALADVTPDSPFLFQNEKRRSQHWSRDAYEIRKGSLRWKARTGLEAAVVQKGTQLHQ